MKWIWLQRRWWEFKAGDAGYLRYFISFLQFIILTYTLGVQRFSWLEAVFSSVLLYTMTFFLFYVPMSIFIGHFIHRKKQLRPETIIAIEQNVIAGYNAYVGMKLWVDIMRKKWGVEPSEEYLEMMEFWKTIAGDWKPNTT